MKSDRFIVFVVCLYLTIVLDTVKLQKLPSTPSSININITRYRRQSADINGKCYVLSREVVSTNTKHVNVSLEYSIRCVFLQPCWHHLEIIKMKKRGFLHIYNKLMSRFNELETAEYSKIIIRFFCTLPAHPDNGRWTVLNGAGKPGETISINSVLKYECNTGYKLSSQSTYVVCDANWNSQNNVRECEKLCPPMYSTSTTILTCVDKKGNEIKCHESTEGSYLTYTCAPFYETPFGYKKSLLCVDGTWNYQKPVCQPVCGKKINDDVKPLIFGGEVKNVIEYPWITALYSKRNNEYVNICGGSLISPRVVLTAAHCVTNTIGEVLEKQKFQVAAGKLYNKHNDPRDSAAQYLEIFRIMVHPGYKGESRRFIADLAILVTQRPFTLNNFVQPVCFNDVNNVHLHAGNKGAISGWGVKEDGLPSDELRTLEIPYKYETTCAQELPTEWAEKYNMIDKMCAGFVNKSLSVCQGDSGNGLVFKNSDNNRYYVHGIVSIGPSVKGECNIQQNSLYTKVAFYYDYIDKEIAKYYTDDCLLPPYPDNGRWVVANRDVRPGDAVSGNTILKVTCKQGFKLSLENSQVDCISAVRMPTCQPLCPSLKFPPATDFNCKNQTDQTVRCADATDYTTLTYTCPENYGIPEGTKNTRVCMNGSWGSPTPQCLPKPATTTVVPRVSEGNRTQVICSYASWQSYKDVNPEDFDASLCTHVNYAFIGLWPDGKLRAQDKSLDLSEHKRGLYHRVTDMKKKNVNLKVLLSVGGSGASNASLFSSMAADPGKRTAFINSAKQFLETYNFDGLDIEWHVPETGDKNNYITLLREVNQALKQRGWLLTATVRSDPSSTGYDGTEMNKILDWVNVKTYDMYGEWSKYTGQNSALYPSTTEYDWEKEHLNVDAAAKNWIRAGISKNKLALSIAFFGRSFTLQDKSEHGVHAPISGAGPGESGGFLRYSEICQKYKNWTRVWDSDQKNPYKYHENKWFGYDDIESVRIKAHYISNKGYFGVNVWPVDGDDVHGKCGQKQVLLKEVHRGLSEDGGSIYFT